MAEIHFLVGLLCWRLSYVKTCCDQRTIQRLKLPLLGCAVALAAGCTSMGSQQTSSVDPSVHLGRSGTTPPIYTQSPPNPFPKWELEIPDHPAIDTWVQRFSGDKHKSFQTQLDRAILYAVPAQEVFEKQGLPRDLIYVALIESGFTPTARSHANAVGMWQFISTTGKRFGLEQNRWVDERCHPMKAARAAADYLSFLYDTFHSWPLALAAYNAGENAVQGALDQSGLKTFWELAENRYLPSETRDYVPKVLAAVKIVRDVAHYGFRFESQRYVQRHETVPIPGGVKLSWVGNKIGVSEASLQYFNPELCKPVTPPGCSSYELCVPLGKGEDVLNVLSECSPPVERFDDKAPAGRPGPFNLSYKTRPGDSWTSLARKYKCSVKTLAALNGLKPSQSLKAGQTLRVPVGEPSLAVVASAQKKEIREKVSGSGLARKKPAGAGQKSSQPVYYPVRQGDTLWSIAEKFRIPVKALCASNELKPNQKLIPGNMLAIHTNLQESGRTAKRRSN